MDKAILLITAKKKKEEGTSISLENISAQGNIDTSSEKLI